MTAFEPTSRGVQELLSSPFGGYWNFARHDVDDLPTQFDANSTGDHTFDSSNIGFQILGDGDGSAELSGPHARSGRYSRVFYHAFYRGHGFTGGDEFLVGQFDEQGGDGWYLDLSRNEYYVNGATAELDFDITDVGSRAFQIWTSIDHARDPTFRSVVYADQNYDLVEIDKTIAGTSQDNILYVENITNDTRFQEFGYGGAVPSEFIG